MAEEVKAMTAAEKKAAAAAAAEEKPRQDPYEMVKIRLHMDKQHMEPLSVVVNTFEAKIPRGVDYEVPFYVAKHIEEMEAQDNRTLLLTRRLVEEFDRKSRALGNV